MAINLQKGQKIEIGLSKLTIGLGWDPNEGTGHDFDLDASAFLLNKDRRLVKESHFIFYNNLCGLGHNENNPCEKNGFPSLWEVIPVRETASHRSVSSFV